MSKKADFAQVCKELLLEIHCSFRLLEEKEET
jgi:hypothetical protein